MTNFVFKNEQIQQKDPCLSGERADLPKEYGYVNKSVIRCLRYSGNNLFKSLLIQSLGTKNLYFSHRARTLAYFNIFTDKVCANLSCLLTYVRSVFTKCHKGTEFMLSLC